MKFYSLNAIHSTGKKQQNIIQTPGVWDLWETPGGVCSFQVLKSCLAYSVILPSRVLRNHQTSWRSTSESKTGFELYLLVYRCRDIGSTTVCQPCRSVLARPDLMCPGIRHSETLNSGSTASNSQNTFARKTAGPSHAVGISRVNTGFLFLVQPYHQPKIVFMKADGSQPHVHWIDKRFHSP